MRFIALNIKADLYLVLHCHMSCVFDDSQMSSIHTDGQTDRQRGGEGEIPTHRQYTLAHLFEIAVQ